MSLPRSRDDPISRALRAGEISRNGSEFELRKRPGHAQMWVPAQRTVDDRIAARGAGKLERIDGFVEPCSARTTTRKSRCQKDAVGAGAEVVMPLENQFWGAQYGKLRDPFGHVWAIGGPEKK